TAFDGSLAGPGTNDGVRIEAQKRIASDFFAALDRFKQKGKLAEPLDLEIGSDRSQEVSHHPLDHRNYGSFTRKFQEFVVSWRAQAFHRSSGSILFLL